jgi:multidrug efflux pump subunit AcrA (membrane-fusion protein)
VEDAVVTRLEGTARPPFGSVRVYVSADSPCLETRSTGTPVEVTFHLEGAPDARFLPLSAVDFRGGSPRVFRVGADDRVEVVPVTLGALAGDVQELFGALSAEDRVVVTGASNLRPGDRVRVVARSEGGLP